MAAGLRHRLDLDRAVRDGLAVYYFPGRWEWDRAVVRPLAFAALEKTLRGQDSTRKEPITSSKVVARARKVSAGSAWNTTLMSVEPLNRK